MPARRTSLLQVADGGMARIGDILQRMKALAVQAQSGSVTTTSAPSWTRNIRASAPRPTDIASQTKFNGSVAAVRRCRQVGRLLGAGFTAAGIAVEPQRQCRHGHFDARL